MKLCKLFWVAGGLLAVLLLARGPTAAQASEGQRLLQQLIEGAKKEGQLDWYYLSNLGAKGSKEMVQAFNQRFGLNIRVNSSTGGTSKTFSKAVMESKTGITPTYDVMYGNGNRVVRLWQNEGVAKIDKWEVLLKEISPEAYRLRDKVSPLDLAGSAFQWGNRISALLYNTELISEAELPKTRVALGDPKYKGMYSLAPFTTTAQYGILLNTKDRWLEVVSSWSAWGPSIIKYSGAVKRMLLGEFKFMPGNAYYYFKYKARDPKSPIGLAFFKDLTPSSFTFHVVRKGAKHPNAAKLFALWATSSEANRIFEKPKYAATPNLSLGTGPISRQLKKTLGEKNIKVVSWWDSRKSFKKLLWYNTKEGKKYGKKLGKAQTGRK